MSTLSHLIVISQLSLLVLIAFGLGPSTSLAVHNNSVRRSVAPVQPKSLAEWEELFNLRSEDDWRQAWHEEKHRRCNHQLIAHMDLVCDKDIYKLQRKRKKRDVFPTYNQANDNPFPGLGKLSHFLLSPSQANLFGRRLLKRMSNTLDTYSDNRARYKRGITEECCQGQDGCSWEEYAEYCPANVRVRISNSL